jgi:membrane-bound lytic murein transglycosylase D
MSSSSVVTILAMLSHRTIDHALSALALAIFLSGCALLDFRTINKPPSNERARPMVALPQTVEAEPPKLDEERDNVVRHAPATDTWVRLAKTFMLPASDHTSISKAIESFAARPKHFQRASRRAEPYLWYLAEQLNARALPAELALLPLIESGYRAHAISPAGAAGLWQFMPATGRRYGLTETPWYDERRDIIASTRAALEYLADLQANFAGDWLLALAAYNCGPAKVRRAMQAHDSSDFWTISADLPAETQHFVPKILAAIAIVRDPAASAINLHPIDNAPWFEEIDLGAPIDLISLVQDTGWSEISFARLNPGYLRSFTHPNGPFRVLVPIQLSEGVTNFIEQIPAQSRLAARIHVVVAGETLSAIARRYDSSVRALQTTNKINGTNIGIGRELLVPYAAEEIHSVTDSRSNQHTVVQGESLWSIARQYGLSHGALAAQNNLPLSVVLQPGQRLLVQTTRLTEQTYYVVLGDSLWTIARKFNVTVAQLRKWNKLPPRKSLQPGQSLIITNPSMNNA